MKNAQYLYYAAAVLFLAAAILNFANGAPGRGAFSLVPAAALILAGYRYKRRNKILD